MRHIICIIVALLLVILFSAVMYCVSDEPLWSSCLLPLAIWPFFWALLETLSYRKGSRFHIWLAGCVFGVLFLVFYPLAVWQAITAPSSSHVVWVILTPWQLLLGYRVLRLQYPKDRDPTLADPQPAAPAP